MEDTFFWYLGQASSLAVIIPLVLALFRFRQFDLVQKRVTYLLSAMFLAEVSANILWRQSINNNPIFHMYAVVEFILILNVFRTVRHPFFRPQVFNGLVILFTVLALVNAIWLDGLYRFNGRITTLSGGLVILIALTYFYSLLKADEYQPLGRIPLFWASAGLIIYFSSTLMLFFITAEDTFSENQANLLWGLHSIFNIVLMLFYTITLWIPPQRGSH